MHFDGCHERLARWHSRKACADVSITIQKAIIVPIPLTGAALLATAAYSVKDMSDASR